MSRIVEVPGGQATLRAAGEVKQRARRQLESASVQASPAIGKFPKDQDPTKLNVGELGLTREEFNALYDLQDATILAYLESWTLALPLPQNADDLGELPVELYDALRTVTAPDGANTVAPVDFSPNPDPEGPTADSGVSETPLTAAPESTSTETSPTGGESSPIDGSLVA